MSAPLPGQASKAWQQTAVEAFCRDRPCGQHQLLKTHLDEELVFDEICQIIRETIGCPLFRDLETDDARVTAP